MHVASFTLMLLGSMAACSTVTVTKPEPVPPRAIASTAVASAGSEDVKPGTGVALQPPVPGPIGECRGRGETATFTLAHINDMQARYSDRVDGKSRYARVSGILRAIAAEVPATLVLDAGDDYEKGSLVDLRTSGAATTRIVHALPIHARTLGNHDFAYGDVAVRADVRASPHPVISTNVRDVEDGELLRPYMRFDVGCVRVGVVGLVTQPYGSDDEQVVAGDYGAFDVDPRVVRVATDVVQRHRGEVDVMIALSHLGKGPDTYLAREVSGLDVVVGGHSEDTIIKPLRVVRPDGSSAVVLQAGHFGELVGRADFVVGLREPKVEVDRYRLVPVDASAPVDDVIDRLVTQIENDAVPNLLDPIAQVGKERSPRELVTLLAHAASRELEADAILVGKDAFWGKLPAGPLTLQRLYELVFTQKQPVGTPGFTSLWMIDVTADELARIKKSVRRGPRYVFESIANAKATPKRPLRLAVEKRLLEHSNLATNPPARFPPPADAARGRPGARFGGELIDVLEKYARAQTARGAAFDSAL